MSLETNKVTARRYLQGDPDEGRDNVDVFDEICDPDIAMIGDAGFGEIHGLENLKQAARLHSLASRETLIEEMIAEGDKVAVSYTIRMTRPFKAPVTLPSGITIPAGKLFTLSGVSIITLRAGKVIEERAWADWLAVMQQLGITSDSREKNF